MRAHQSLAGQHRGVYHLLCYGAVLGEHPETGVSANSRAISRLFPSHEFHKWAFLDGPLDGSEIHAVHEFLKTFIGAQRVEGRIEFDPSEVKISFRSMLSRASGMLLPFLLMRYTGSRKNKGDVGSGGLILFTNYLAREGACPIIVRCQCRLLACYYLDAQSEKTMLRRAT